MTAIEIPLARCADEIIGKLASVTGSKAIAALDGATLLGERAMRAGMRIPGAISAGGGCRMLDAIDDTIALNLSRPADRELLPALFATDELDPLDDAAIAARIAKCDASTLLLRGRELGLAIAARHERESAADAACVELVSGIPAIAPMRRAPLVIDLSALWAGPLASHLLWLAGAEVLKVESRTRPDAMRTGDAPFFALLNQGKASIAVDFTDHNDRRALCSLISTADIVIEAARPRALAQLDIDAAHFVRTTPGLAWITITAHGAQGQPANWVGFGDDCGVSGGLSAALHAATNRNGFVGDAIADPLTGMAAALAAWQAWTSRRGCRLGLAMSRVVSQSIARARGENEVLLQQQLRCWGANVGNPFPEVARRSIGSLSGFGEHSRDWLARFAAC